MARREAIRATLACSSCPALCRASTPLQQQKDVDGRDKPGHDERDGPRIAFRVIRATLRHEATLPEERP